MSTKVMESVKPETPDLLHLHQLQPMDLLQTGEATIIRRTGIERLAAAAGMRISYETCVVERDFAAVKATAKTGKGTAIVAVEAFGSSASAGQGAQNLALAQRRAKSCAVLQLAGLYQVPGVHGEDEPLATVPPAARPSQPAAPAPTPPASTIPTAPAAVDESPGEVMAKAQVLDLLRSADSHAQLEAFWKEDVKGVWELDVDVLSAAKEVRARLNAELQAPAA